MIENNARAREVLKDAIVMELEGKEFFEHASGMMTRKRSKDMFLGLVAQERRHIEVLSHELSMLESGRGWSSVGDIKEVSGKPFRSPVFSDREVKKLRLKPDAGELDVIDLGLEVEKKSIEYYKSAELESEDPEAKRVFGWLVSEESGHLSILMAERDSRAGSGFYYDSSEFSLETQ